MRLRKCVPVICATMVRHCTQSRDDGGESATANRAVAEQHADEEEDDVEIVVQERWSAGSRPQRHPDADPHHRKQRREGLQWPDCADVSCARRPPST